MPHLTAPAILVILASQAGSTVTTQKRSTAKGDARAKIISELTRHHKYQDGGCLHLEPIGVRALARQADVAPASVSAFFDREYGGPEKSGGHKKYQVVCLDPGRLAESLKVLNGEFSPHMLYGRNPRDEGGRDED